MSRKRHDDGGDAIGGGAGGGTGTSAGNTAGADAESVERIVSSDGPGAASPGDEDAALRPRTFAEFVGQRKVAENLAVYVKAARQRGDSLDHVLLSGPPGLGKTTLAYLLGHEMGTEVRVTSGPALERKGDLVGS